MCNSFSRQDMCTIQGIGYHRERNFYSGYKVPNSELGKNYGVLYYAVNTRKIWVNTNPQTKEDGFARIPSAIEGSHTTINHGQWAPVLAMTNHNTESIENRLVDQRANILSSGALQEWNGAIKFISKIVIFHNNRNWSVESSNN